MIVPGKKEKEINIKLRKKTRVKVEKLSGISILGARGETLTEQKGDVGKERLLLGREKKGVLRKGGWGG